MGLLPSWFTVQVAFAPLPVPFFQALREIEIETSIGARFDVPAALRPVAQHLGRFRRAGLRHFQAAAPGEDQHRGGRAVPAGADQRLHSRTPS